MHYSAQPGKTGEKRMKKRRKRGRKEYEEKSIRERKRKWEEGVKREEYRRM